MNYKEYVNKNKEIQNKLLLFIDKEDGIEENYHNLINLITIFKIVDNLHELSSLLYLISNVSNNRYRTANFRCKIERLLEYLKESIKNNFTNQKIFDIFQKSKAILLILIEREIITFDKSILKEISSKKYFKRSYHQFFFPEIRPLIQKMKINIQSKETHSTDKDFSENDNEDSSDDDENEDEYNSSENESEEEEDTKIDFFQTRNFQKIYEEFSKKTSRQLFERPSNWTK